LISGFDDVALLGIWKSNNRKFQIMSPNRPFVVSIAGFDPQLEQVLTDIKTFEQHRVYGFAITTANTIQTENQFLSIQWTDIAFVLRSIEELFKNPSHKAVKIGIVPSLAYLQK
jgi:hydroxymethylpyrimidine/phosphomethylpyrimidine kinase